MNSKVLMALAGLLLLGAVLLGYLGVSIGRTPSNAHAPSVAPASATVDASLEKLERKPVLVASRDLPALAVIGKDDLDRTARTRKRTRVRRVPRCWRYRRTAWRG